MSAPKRYAPRVCPVCGGNLALTRLSCENCDTELSGSFRTCEFCALDSDERETLRVFLASRGNMREVERHLGVSYPTARARFDALLGKLGIDQGSSPAGESRQSVLESLARGELDIDQALRQLG
ncbi:MAG: DUF2089 family protein [Chloroflexota bacterium]